MKKKFFTVRGDLNDHLSIQKIINNLKPNEIYNIGADNPVSMKQLAEQVIKLSGSSSKIQYVPYEEAFTKEFEDIMYRVPNIDKIRSLGYEPKYSLDDIITDMI